jgi:phosphoglycolate phosphatase
MSSTEPHRLVDLVRGVDAVLFDFDGPLCPLFEDHPAVEVARKMKRLLRAEGWLLKRFERYDDTHRLLQDAAVAEVPSPVLSRLEVLLTDEETKAAAKARPTPGALELIRTLDGAGRPMAITTNNSPASVQTYLTSNGLEGWFDGRVFGRMPGRPTLMKPHPACVLRALEELGLENARGNCLMIGDSVNDLRAAERAGVRFLAFAKSDAKKEKFTAKGAKVQVTDMEEVTRGFLGADLTDPGAPVAGE